MQRVSAFLLRPTPILDYKLYSLLMHTRGFSYRYSLRIGSVSRPESYAALKQVTQLARIYNAYGARLATDQLSVLISDARKTSER